MPLFYFPGNKKNISREINKIWYWPLILNVVLYLRAISDVEPGQDREIAALTLSTYVHFFLE